MHVRTALLRDIEAISQLVAEYWAFEEIEGFSAEHVERNLAMLIQNPAYGAIWLACDQAHIVGYLILVQLFSLEYGGMMAEIDEFYLRPEYRAGGTGSLLLATVEQAAIAAGDTAMQLAVGHTNTRARQFYTRHGYQERTGYAILEKSFAR